ncbi:MAG: hypothetical protein K2X74_00480 [Acetobacteraceae bacterium]|nr:hypothetical protein [Acetobacteraceae bacterium]
MPFDLASAQAAGLPAGGDLIPVALGGAPVRFAGAVFTCATDAAGTYTAPIRLPRGARVLGLILNSSVTLGGIATIAIGIAGAAGKYRAAATYTPVDTLTLVGLNAALLVPLAAEEQILLTVAAASLPASGRFFFGFLYTTNH